MKIIKYQDKIDTVKSLETKKNALNNWLEMLRILLIILIGLIWIIPFYYLIITIFKSPQEYVTSNPLSIPSGVSPLIENIRVAWNQAQIGKGIKNSITYGVISSSLSVLIALMAAHGLTRYQYKGKTIIFLIMISGMIFPLQIYLMPIFFQYKALGLLDSKLGMILFYTAICIPFPVLVFRNYLNQISIDGVDAARVDGCPEWKIFLFLTIPSSISPILACFLLQFTWIWNDLIFSMVLTQSSDARSVMPMLQVFQGAYAIYSQTIVMTAALLATLPTVLLFISLRKYFMHGLQVSSS